MEMIDLSKITPLQISSILNNFLIDHEIDEDDNDVVVDDISRFYIRINKEKGVIEFYTNMRINEKKELSTLDTYEFITRLNIVSDTVNYAMIAKKGIHCSYSIPMDGIVNEKFFVKAVKLVTKSLSTTEVLIQDPKGFLTEISDSE